MAAFQHRRRVTYDDISSQDHHVHSFQHDTSDHILFTTIMSLIVAIAVGMVTEYAQNQYAISGTDHSVAGVASFVGGMLAIVSRVQNHVGKLLIKFILHRKLRRVSVAV
jgi:hypothetical protein